MLANYPTYPVINCSGCFKILLVEMQALWGEPLRCTRMRNDKSNGKHEINATRRLYCVHVRTCEGVRNKAQVGRVECFGHRGKYGSKCPRCGNASLACEGGQTQLERTSMGK